MHNQTYKASFHQKLESIQRNLALAITRLLLQGNLKRIINCNHVYSIFILPQVKRSVINSNKLVYTGKKELVNLEEGLKNLVVE